MTPYTFAQEYYAVSVSVPASKLAAAGMYTVCIDRYRINEAGGYACDLVEKDRLVAKLREAIKKAKPGDPNTPPAGDASAIARAFFAKGSPADFGVALRTAVLYGGVKPADLQAYADKHLGIDCSGFVNQYWIRTSRLGGYDKSRTISTYGAADRRRSSIKSDKSKDPKAICAQDMLVWSNFGHIALVDSLTYGKTTQATIVESTAHAFAGHHDGLVRTTYEIQSVNEKSKKFKVLRGGSTVELYIVSFDAVGK